MRTFACFLAIAVFAFPTVASALKDRGNQCYQNFECKSGVCYSYVDRQKYCIDRQKGCAVPGTAGVDINTRIRYGGRYYLCQKGGAWKPVPDTNSQ